MELDTILNQFLMVLTQVYSYHRKHKTLFLQHILQYVGRTKERIAYIEKYSERIFSTESFLLHQDLLQCFMLTLA